MNRFLAYDIGGKCAAILDHEATAGTGGEPVWMPLAVLATLFTRAYPQLYDTLGYPLTPRSKRSTARTLARFLADGLRAHPHPEVAESLLASLDGPYELIYTHVGRVDPAGDLLSGGA